jgi:hypothetical protein
MSVRDCLFNGDCINSDRIPYTLTEYNSEGITINGRQFPYSDLALVDWGLCFVEFVTVSQGDSIVINFDIHDMARHTVMEYYLVHKR